MCVFLILVEMLSVCCGICYTHKFVVGLCCILKGGCQIPMFFFIFLFCFVLFLFSNLLMAFSCTTPMEQTAGEESNFFR